MTDIQIITQNNTLTSNIEDKRISIARNFYELKNMVQYSNDMLDLVYTKNEKGEIIIKNVNFYDLELIEESFDELFYEFSQIKGKIAEVRKQLFTNNKQ
jgi:hypothetical protein